MEALDNVWYGSWRPLTNVTQTVQACHLCTFNMATIFWWCHPYNDSVWLMLLVVTWLRIHSQRIDPKCCITSRKSAIIHGIEIHSFCTNAKAVAKIVLCVNTSFRQLFFISWQHIIKLYSYKKVLLDASRRQVSRPKGNMSMKGGTCTTIHPWQQSDNPTIK